ncbi:hypothetical protein [Streptomyces tropicalis]|uniref:Secreted protein n=1 Tax=Streptomyces tropicalis TaxID=3034234 RepID=A0ABT6A209_9ACTN|nr:hypothetical protein [Streptomyces tropicalis]MDF3298669.1 hypothetical protein [Streptomyces tropicalis]
MKSIAKGVAGALLAVGAVMAPLATQASAATAPAAAHRDPSPVRDHTGDHRGDRDFGWLRHGGRDDDRRYDHDGRHDHDGWFDRDRYDRDGWFDRDRYDFRESCRRYDDRYRMTYRYRWDRRHHSWECYPYGRR